MGSYDVRVVRTYHVPSVGADGNIHQVTRVQALVGNNGPFFQDFGPGQNFPDTADGINQWKSELAAKLMQVGATS